MEVNNLPKTNPSKNKIIGFFILLIAFIGGIIFFLEKLFSDFEPSSPIDNNIEQENEDRTSYKGTVKYVPPETYGTENIEYKLVDENKKDIILLKSVDDKLKVAENLFVTVKGKKAITSGGLPLLIVTEVIVSN